VQDVASVVRKDVRHRCGHREDRDVWQRVEGIRAALCRSCVAREQRNVQASAAKR